LRRYGGAARRVEDLLRFLNGDSVGAFMRVWLSRAAGAGHAAAAAVPRYANDEI
jgi:hypothetical protein